MNKLPCNELTLSLSLSLSLCETVKVKKITTWSLWATYFSDFADFGKDKVDHFSTDNTSFGQAIIFTSSFYSIILYFWQVRHLFTPEFHNKKYAKEALGFSKVNCHPRKSSSCKSIRESRNCFFLMNPSELTTFYRCKWIRASKHVNDCKLCLNDFEYLKSCKTEKTWFSLSQRFNRTSGNMGEETGSRSRFN